MNAKRTIRKLFVKATRRNHYNLFEGNKNLFSKVIGEMPLENAIPEMLKFVKKKHLGNSLHYSMYLLSKFPKKVEARLASIPAPDVLSERRDTYYCVWYKLDGKEYIADLAMALDDTYGAIYSSIPLNEYLITKLEKDEFLSIYPKLKSDVILSEFISKPERRVPRIS